MLVTRPRRAFALRFNSLALFTLVFSRLRPRRAFALRFTSFALLRSYFHVYARIALCRGYMLPHPLLSVAARRFAAPAFIGCRSTVCRTAFIGCRSAVCRTAFIGCRSAVCRTRFYRLPRLRIRKFLRFFRVKSSAAPRFAVFGFGYSLAFTPRALRLVLYGAPALPLRSRTEVGRTRLCGLPARLKVICYTFDRKNNFPTVLTAKDPPPSNL